MTVSKRWGVISFADSLDCVGIIGKDVTSTSKVFGSLCKFLFLRLFHLSEFQDVLSQFDERDPTAARPMTREKARELCSEHMAEWASWGSGSLKNLRIGIPQVPRFASLSIRPTYPIQIHRNTFQLRSTGPSSLPSAASFEPSRIAVRPCSPFPSQIPVTP